jgi:hypothetical protein
MKVTLPRDRITVVLTSCGRWDLLVQSLDTFLSHHAPGRFLLIDDSADRAFAERIGARYPGIEVILNDPRLGQHASIDKAYAQVSTPWIVHLEDDWFFTGPMDVTDAMALMNDDASIAAVCFSVFRKLKFRHRIFGTTFRHGDRLYGDLRRAHRDWYGFSYYPTLLRRSLWEEFGPYARFPNERSISRTLKDRGLGIVQQLPGVGMHVGSGHSVFDPARANEKRRITGSLWRRLSGQGVFRSTSKERSGFRS